MNEATSAYRISGVPTPPFRAESTAYDLSRNRAPICRTMVFPIRIWSRIQRIELWNIATHLRTDEEPNTKRKIVKACYPLAIAILIDE